MRCLHPACLYSDMAAGKSLSHSLMSAASSNSDRVSSPKARLRCSHVDIGSWEREVGEEGEEEELVAPRMEDSRKVETGSRSSSRT